MKLLILILASKNTSNINFDDILNNGALKTWASKEYENENIKILPFLGEHHTIEIVDNKLLINTIDKFLTTKTLKAFEYVLNNFEFDYLIRPNVSTYVRIDKIYEYLLNKSRTKFYCGPKNNYDGITYPSGTNMMFSRDIIEIIVKGKDQIKYNEWADDWCIGKYLHINGIEMSDELDHYWGIYGVWPEQEIMKKLYSLKKEDIDNYITFRCKTEIAGDNLSSVLGKRNDIEKMIHIHKLLNS